MTEEQRSEADEASRPAGEDEEFVLPEPDTESVGRSPITGQTADESQDKPGQ